MGKSIYQRSSRCGERKDISFFKFRDGRSEVQKGEPKVTLNVFNMKVALLKVLFFSTPGVREAGEGNTEAGNFRLVSRGFPELLYAKRRSKVASLRSGKLNLMKDQAQGVH